MLRAITNEALAPHFESSVFIKIKESVGLIVPLLSGDYAKISKVKIKFGRMKKKICEIIVFGFN